MTRRAFLQSLLLAPFAAAAGPLLHAGTLPAPCRVRRASAPLRYPGPLRPLRHVRQPGIWRG
ncbi:MAG: hypothetical protein GX571_13470 [Lentisphaerae bacterium]|nr:hypothetical protein [Lentisphaerota bacterium]